MPFCLDPETGFSWIGEYDITADELLSGAGGNTATKTEQAERLILDLLADGKELASEDIVKAAAEAGIYRKDGTERQAQHGRHFRRKACRRSMVQLHQEEAATRTRKLKVQNADPLHFALSHFHDNLRQ